MRTLRMGSESLLWLLALAGSAHAQSPFTGTWVTHSFGVPNVIDLRVDVRRSTLDSRQRSIIYFRFFEEASQAEVARRLGISQMHVSRLERQALKRLKALLA